MADRSSKTLQLTRPAGGPKQARSSSEARVHRVPRLCLLDGFAEGLNDSRGVNLMRLETLTQLRVKTADTLYQITVLDPFKSRILIEGGMLFAGGREVTLSGASLGRSFLKMRCIWLGLQMELHTGDCTVVTSPVSSIEILDDTFPTGSFAA